MGNYISNLRNQSRSLSQYLPRICLAGAENPHASPQLYDPKTLLQALLRMSPQ
ncbi:MAG UNVERIFIED_CONTAM: hypothetical protein LVR29_15785 [Microcystis novacekii LVE1205-3]